MDKPEDIAKLLPLSEIYKDLAQPAVKQVGGALESTAKVARLLLAPIEYLAAQSDRWQRYLERIAKQVPEERRIEAHPQVAGPVLEGLRYVDEHNIIADLFVNLLARAIDHDRVSEAHPAFASIISQLSSDEAQIIFWPQKKVMSTASIRLSTLNKVLFQQGRSLKMSFLLKNSSSLKILQSTWITSTV